MVGWFFALGMMSAGCGDDGDNADRRFPDVLEVVVTADELGTYTVDVTMSSPYDTPERYADGWRIVGPDGSVYGIRLLQHDHANEQPFTRSLTGVRIPPGIDTITVQGRDSRFRWGGGTADAPVPPSVGEPSSDDADS